MGGNPEDDIFTSMLGTTTMTKPKPIHAPKTNKTFSSPPTKPGSRWAAQQSSATAAIASSKTNNIDNSFAKKPLTTISTQRTPSLGSGSSLGVAASASESVPTVTTTTTTISSGFHDNDIGNDDDIDVGDTDWGDDDADLDDLLFD